MVGPDGWAQRVRAGQRVIGGLHLATDEDVVTGSVVGGLEQVRGASYVVRGRVVDARAGELTVELYDRSRLRVETGSHRIRADIRDPTEIHGTLCFTPAGFTRGLERFTFINLLSNGSGCPTVLYIWSTDVKRRDR